LSFDILLHPPEWRHLCAGIVLRIVAKVNAVDKKTRSSAIAVIADRTAYSSSLRSAKTLLRDFYFNAIHCD